jgi:hypothetical protein
MSVIEDFQDELHEAFLDTFGRPVVSATSFLLALPLLGFPIHKAIVIAIIVFIASLGYAGRRSLHIASVLLLLYAIPVFLEVAPTPSEIIAFTGNHASVLTACQQLAGPLTP